MRIKKGLLMLCMAVAMTIAIPTIGSNVGNVSIVEAASKVKLNKKKVTLYVGKTITLKLKGAKKKVKWSSNKKSVATVSSKGKVKAKKKGTATITAKVGKKKYKCKVTVKAKKKKAPAISVNTQDITIKDSGRIYVTYNDTKAQVYGEVSDTSVISASWHPTYQVGNTRAIDIVALRNGVSYIELTNNIDSTKITIKVTVSGHVEPIQYIGDRSVDYDSIKKEHRLFFSLLLGDQTTGVASSGVANIKIVNDDGIEVYNKAVRFTQSDFSTWTWALLGSKYICCVKIPDSDLIKSTSSSGKLTFNVKLDDGTSFSDSTYNISNLPLQDLKEVCRVALPTMPTTISSYDVWGALDSSCLVTNVNYTVEPSIYKSKYDIKISISGKKTYDVEGNNHSSYGYIGWKLYKDDVVVDSGIFMPSGLAVGDKFENETTTIYNVEEGDYRLELLDYES